MKVQASETTEQSSITSVSVSEFIFITDLNSHSGRFFSSASISINANEKSRFTLSRIPSFKLLSCFSKESVAPGLTLLKTALRFVRFTPKVSSSFSMSNSEKREFGILKYIIATFAGSIAVRDIPSLLIFMRTSVTNSEIIVMMSEKILGLCSVNFIVF